MDRSSHTIDSLLRRAAERRPDHVAVACDAAALTYAGLDERAAAIASALCDVGVRRGARVALLMNKSVDAIAALYGTMRAGAIAVPIDTALPAGRIAHTLLDCGVDGVIADASAEAVVAAAARAGVPLKWAIGLDRFPDDAALTTMTWEAALQSSTASPAAPQPDDLAYVLYTSGSTGEPKGIAHTHASAVAFASWGYTEFHLSAADRLGNHAPLHFDLSTFDLFAGAAACATTVLMPRRTTLFAGDVARLIAREQLTIWYSVPSVWVQMIRAGVLGEIDLSSLRVVLFAGERFPAQALRTTMQHLRQARFANLFGPTETNVCLWYEIGDPDRAGDPIPIGRACPYVDTRIADAEDETSPATGELLVRGATVMAGYWGKPDLTSQAFTGEGFYRTGDVVSRGADGVYHFIGRTDRQVKVRGVRVELDEVEAALLADPRVVEAAAWVEPDTAEAPAHVAAAIVTSVDDPSVERDILRHAASRLAPAAVPARLERRAALPKTATGKIDRMAVRV